MWSYAPLSLRYYNIVKVISGSAVTLLLTLFPFRAESVSSTRKSNTVFIEVKRQKLVDGVGIEPTVQRALPMS